MLKYKCKEKHAKIWFYSCLLHGQRSVRLKGERGLGSVEVDVGVVDVLPLLLLQTVVVRPAVLDFVGLEDRGGDGGLGGSGGLGDYVVQVCCK